MENMNIASLAEYNSLSRRHFLSSAGLGLGGLGLASLLEPRLFAENAPAAPVATGAADTAGGLPGFPNFAAKAKRVIYLFQ